MTRRLNAIVVVALVAALPMTGEAAKRWYGHGGGGGYHGGGGGYGYGHHHGHSSFALSLGFGLVGAPWGYNFPSYYEPWPVYAAPVYSAPVYGDSAYRRGEYGQVETNVRPQSATVYLDGNPVGIADDFDGWPSKLYVTPGTHELVFREPGYSPYRVTVQVIPYHSVKVQYRLQHGADDYVPEAARPQSVPPPSAGRAEPGAPPARRHGDNIGTLQLDVQPADSDLFVDGNKVEGHGRFALNLPPGPHRVEVAHPGFDVFTGEVVVHDGQRQELTVRLTRDAAPGW